MSDRPLIFLGIEGSQHLVVPCCCSGHGIGHSPVGNVLQCEVGLGNSQPVIDFTSPFSNTQVAPVGGGIGSGRGDVPETSDGDSLDLFTTSCSMGDPHKRNLAVDADETQLQSDDGLCAYKQDLMHIVIDDSSADGYGPCSSRITDHCETFAFDPPDGYIIDTRTPSNICSFDDLQTRTGKTIHLDGPTEGDNRMGCSYNYRKNWDDPFWETPGEIYNADPVALATATSEEAEAAAAAAAAETEYIAAQNSAGEAVREFNRLMRDLNHPQNLDYDSIQDLIQRAPRVETRITEEQARVSAARAERERAVAREIETASVVSSLSITANDGSQKYNDNNIPIKRMECCIGHYILEDGTVDMDSPLDYNECPVDTNRYNFRGGTDGGTVNGSVDGIAPDNHDYDDKIRAYVPESLMCDGRSSQEGGIELTKTPQHWCTYNMQDNFDIANYDDYYSMLNDNHCKEWLKLDDERASVNPNNPRANAYSRNLSEFYKWISGELANNYELKPFIHHTHVPIDTTLELTMSNRSDFRDHVVGSNFDISNDYGKFISLLKIKSPNEGADDAPLVKMFLNHADKADRDRFNENMTKFCNRRDIFNFKDYSVDANIPYNSELENTYKDLCACYWNKNIDFTPTNQTDEIYQMLHSLSSRSHSAAADQIALDLQDTLDVDRKNQCWYNGCMGNVGGIQEPYREGPTTDDDIEECPDSCIGISFSETLINLQNSILTDTSIDASAHADAEVNCNQDQSSMSPAPLVSSLSELHRLVDDVEESNPETGTGTGAGTGTGTGAGTGTGTGAGSGADTSDTEKKISIVIKIIYLLLFIIVGYKALSFIFE